MIIVNTISKETKR